MAEIKIKTKLVMKFNELLYMREGYVGIGTPLLSRVRSDIFQYQGFYIRVRVRD